MKKFLTIAALVFYSITTAQKLDNVQKNFVILKYEDAKTEIDKISTDANFANKPEVLLWKARIYAILFAKESSRAKYPNAGITAFEAFSKYVTADPETKILGETNKLPNIGSVLDDIYTTYGNLAATCFNKKDWECAFENYKATAAMGELLTKYNWKQNNQTLDTLSVFYAGYSAEQLKKKEETVKYYSLLANQKIGGEEKEFVYDYLTTHFMQTKNLEMVSKYAAIATQLYPANASIWHKRELYTMQEALPLEEKDKRFIAGKALGNFTADDYVSYGDMFTTLNKDEKTNLDSAKKEYYHVKAIEAYISAYEKDIKNAISAYNVGVLTNAQFGTYDERQIAYRRLLQDLNSNKTVEKDPKKKVAAEANFKKKADALKAEIAAIDKPKMEKANIAIEWLEKAFAQFDANPNRTKEETRCLRQSIDNLAELYGYKRDKVKTTDPKAYDAYDAKYKKYDALHGKY